MRRAFDYAGRPYDYNFDFRTDSEIVCTELVYESYRSDPELPGLRLPLVSVVGRPALPANEIARLFADEDGEPDAQFDLVAFIDGDERTGTASESTRSEFLDMRLTFRKFLNSCLRFWQLSLFSCLPIILQL